MVLFCYFVLAEEGNSDVLEAVWEECSGGG